MELISFINMFILITEQYISLQCWNVGNSSRAAEALASTTSVHAPHGTLYRKNYGSGEKLWATDYCEKDINQVSIVFTGIVLDLKQIQIFIRFP